MAAHRKWANIEHGKTAHHTRHGKAIARVRAGDEVVRRPATSAERALRLAIRIGLVLGQTQGGGTRVYRLEALDEVQPLYQRVGVCAEEMAPL